MERPVYLLILILVGVLSSGTQASADDRDPDPFTEQILGHVSSAESDGSAVTLAGRADTREVGRAEKSPLKPRPRTATPLTERAIQSLLDEACYGDGQCGTRDPGTLNPLIITEEAEPADPGEPGRTVTIEDVARFLPARGVLHGEPSGWAVVGVPANFWVEVEPMTVTGELLGDVAQVRFTPTLYTFDYGDGTTRTSAEPGSSWRDLGQDELSATPTGHVFRERGDRPVKVTIAYTAEYRVDGGAWIGVAGAVSAAAPVVDTLVVAERTVLTAGASR